MFREMLVKSIRSNPLAALQSEKIRQAAESLKFDDSGWDSLSGPQREARRIKAFAKSAEKLSDLECAVLLSREPTVTAQVLEIVNTLVSIDKPNAANPTRLQLLDTVARRVREGRPLEMIASLCLEKGPGLRDGKLDWFLGGKTNPTPEVLATDASIKGWAKVKRILDEVKYPTKVTFLLGDLDYAIVDGCQSWCQPGWEDTLRRDTARIAGKTQELANAWFGAERGVRVIPWSDLYTASEIAAQLPRAEALVTPTKSPAIIRGSFDMYKKQWGYAALAQKMGLDEDTLNSFIIGDVQRMAAQYRVEANYVQARDGIQLWCEAVPNPGWPLQLSNFNGAGFIASLIMD